MKNFHYIMSLLLFLLVMGCRQTTNERPENVTTSGVRDYSGVSKAFADLLPSSGSSVSGRATFEATEEGVLLVLILQGVPPGPHALHLHQNGNCTAADASSAGDHWNPTNQKHGRRGQGEFHKGDIDNVVASSDSTVNFKMMIAGWTIGGPDSTNILDKSVILHQKADDFTSQPAGDAGSRIACGVITMQQNQ